MFKTISCFAFSPVSVWYSIVVVHTTIVYYYISCYMSSLPHNILISKFYVKPKSIVCFTL